MTRRSWIMSAVALCALAGPLLGLFPGAAESWGQTNETVTVEAKAQDNPQANPADIEGHFTESPTGDKDEIHVTNEDVRGSSAGVYNDPVNDGALLTIAQDSGPVKVDVEGREGIGAIYWVGVIPGGGGGGGEPPMLLADVDDIKQPGALVLKDTISGRGESDLTDTDADTPTLYCSTEDGKGKVEFWLVVEADTYDWEIKQGDTTIAKNEPDPLNSTNGWKASWDGLDPGLYQLEVTKSGDTNFKRRIDFAVVEVVFIRQDNTQMPNEGNDSAHMVSKFVTDVNFPDTATYDGPPGDNPDPDTFRVQITGLPSDLSPKVKVRILRGGHATGYSHEFSTVYGPTDSFTYRTDEHVRLVSNSVDDAYRAHQTVLVELEDTVEAMATVDSVELGTISLDVGRPPDEDGDKAIRTCDIYFTTLTGVGSAPQATIDRMSQNWAQCAIRFNLAGSQTVDPVKNVLTLEGTATAAGTLSVTVTPAGGAAKAIQINVANATSAEDAAAALAAAISAKDGLTASEHRHNNMRIILVNKGTEVAFAGIGNNTAGLALAEPVLNFNDDITLLEGSVLGLNFMDDDAKTVDFIVVGMIAVLTADGATGGNYLATNLPGWRNVAIVREELVAANAGAGDDAFGAAHEIGHALFDVGNAGHSDSSTNLFRATWTPDTIGGTKRLTNAQNNDARTKSGPSTTPGLLQKK